MPDGLFTPPPDAEADSQRDPREVSTIAFPYVGLDDAIHTARAIFGQGGVALSRDQLAGAMGQQPNSGNFSVKVAAARLFGLIENQAGKYQLTKLGIEILGCDATKVKAAMVRAFFNVPLYRRAYDEFRNSYLPPRPHGLEGAFVGFGVAQKQKDKARRAFDNSARLAGFFESGDDRLVEPVISPASSNASPGDATNDPLPSRSHRPEALPPAADLPFIRGLLEALPQPGEIWDAEGRVKWLRGAVQAFDLMYQGGTPSIMIAEVDPTKLAWAGFVQQLLAKADEDAATRKMLLGMLSGAWASPSDNSD